MDSVSKAEKVDIQQNDAKLRVKLAKDAMNRIYKPISLHVRIAQLFTLISSILSAAPYVAVVVLGNSFVEAILENRLPYEKETMRTIYYLIGFFAISVLMHFAALFITHLADLKLRNILRRDIVKRVSEVPLAWFTETNSGALRKAIQDDTITVHTVIAHAPVDKLRAIVSPSVLAIFAFFVNWRLGILSILTIPVYMFVYSFGMRGMDEKTMEMDEKLGKVSSTMVEFVSGINVVKAFGQTGKAHKNYSTAARDFSNFYADWSMPYVNSTCFSFFWISVPLILLINLGIGSIFVGQGIVTVPELLATTLIALAVPTTIMDVVNITWSYQLAGGAAIRICNILDTERLKKPVTPKEPSGSDIEVKNVSYSYGETEALNDISLSLKKGTITALLGPSGSGKSTLAKLIARFGDPNQGSITLGGVDLRDIDEKTLYKNISFVLQDAQLLHTSIRNNIALGKQDASLEEIRQAAKIAQIDDFIMSLPKKYDSILGDDTNLSGGQEQRIAIARAILINAPVMILDEATAFADPESEAEIQKALSELVKDRTVLAIAHRPASIIGADQIVILEKGKIVASGRHEDLLDEPHYKTLLKQSFHDKEEGVFNE